MKMKYIIIGIISIVIICGLYFFIKKKENKVEIKDVNIFHLSYSNGYMMNANIIYRLDYDKENDKYMVSVKPYLISDEDKVVVEAPEGFREKIKDILIKYNVDKWNGFDKVDKNVLDGDSFSLFVRMEEDEEIEASGYMEWPDNYRNVVSEYDTLFMEIYNKEKGINE